MEEWLHPTDSGEVPPPRGARRILPSLKQITAAAAQLPAAQDWPEPRIEITLVGPQHEATLTFRRVLARSPEGSVYRWMYEGKVFVT